MEVEEMLCTNKFSSMENRCEMMVMSMSEKIGSTPMHWQLEESIRL